MPNGDTVLGYPNNFFDWKSNPFRPKFQNRVTYHGAPPFTETSSSIKKIREDCWVHLKFSDGMFTARKEYGIQIIHNNRSNTMKYQVRNVLQRMKSLQNEICSDRIIYCVM